MARIHSRAGRLYMGIASGGTAEPVPFISEFTIDLNTDDVDVTAYEDTNKSYVQGLPDIGGSYRGWYDTATAQMVTAALDGVARKFYFYPDRATTTSYWFGTGTFDTSQSFPSGGAGAISGNWKASGVVSKVG